MYSATVYASTHVSRRRFLYAAFVFVGAFVVVGAVAGGFYAWFGPARSRWLLAPSPEPTRPNIVVIDIDTLRADRIDAKEGDAWVMPNLRKLAARGVRFDHMISQGGWTAPALDALLSGRYPLTFSVAGGTMPKRAPGTQVRARPRSLGTSSTTSPQTRTRSTTSPPLAPRSWRDSRPRSPLGATSTGRTKKAQR